VRGNRAKTIGSERGLHRYGWESLIKRCDVSIQIFRNSLRSCEKKLHCEKRLIRFIMPMIRLDRTARRPRPPRLGKKDSSRKRIRFGPFWISLRVIAIDSRRKVGRTFRLSLKRRSHASPTRHSGIL
jgi:hypothetical protein